MEGFKEGFVKLEGSWQEGASSGYVGTWESKGLEGTFFKGPLLENTQTVNSRTSYSRRETLTLQEDGTFEYSCVNSGSCCGTESFEVQEWAEEDAGTGTWRLEQDAIVLLGKFYLDMECGYEDTSDT